MTAEPPPYDPWLHVARTWPEVTVTLEPMTGTLLGWLRYPRIGLRSGTSAAQRRCTLAHELVHLERGVIACGPRDRLWAVREELVVHSAAARRLIALPALARALGELGGDADAGALARLLDVDRDTLDTRLAGLDPAEREALQAQRPHDLWDVA